MLLHYGRKVNLCWNVDENVIISGFDTHSLNLCIQKTYKVIQDLSKLTLSFGSNTVDS